jgi:aminopeptidase N
MVGSNETYRAMMDEGFTQFLTAWALEKIDGKEIVKGKYANAYTEKHSLPEEARYARAYQGYLKDAISGSETTLHTHSDDFGGALRHGGGYGNVYYKTATMLYNLQYVLGDELFSNAMKHYFNQWKMAHPYPEDFRNSIIQYTNVDLNWFFDQWIETSKTIDYGIKKVKHQGDGKYKITIERKGEMQMPVDFSV